MAGRASEFHYVHVHIVILYGNYAGHRITFLQECTR